jgi:hypothetical protein
VRLHAPTALAAASRWSDQGTRGLSKSLQLFLEEAIRLGRLSPSAATALLTFVDYAPDQLRADIVSELGGIEEAAANRVLEELAAECLLLEQPGLIAAQAKVLLDAAKPVKGDRLPTFRRLSQTYQYLQARKAKSPKVKAVKRAVPSLVGQRFITQAAIEAEYSAARKTGGYFDTAAFLSQMISVTSSPGDRVLFLDALAASSINSYSDSTRASVVLVALSEWDLIHRFSSGAHGRSHPLLYVASPASRGGIMEERPFYRLERITRGHSSSEYR